MNSTIHALRIDQKANHVGSLVKSYLEHDEPKILKDLEEERVQRELHSEFEVGL